MNKGLWIFFIFSLIGLINYIATGSPDTLVYPLAGFFIGFLWHLAEPYMITKEEQVK